MRTLAVTLDSNDQLAKKAIPRAVISVLTNMAISFCFSPQIADRNIVATMVDNRLAARIVIFRLVLGSCAFFSALLTKDWFM